MDRQTASNASYYSFMRLGTITPLVVFYTNSTSLGIRSGHCTGGQPAGRIGVPRWSRHSWLVNVYNDHIMSVPGLCYDYLTSVHFYG